MARFRCESWLWTCLSCSFYAHTAAEDVARVEKQTYVCSEKKSDAVPNTNPGVASTLGNWKDPVEMTKELDKKFNGCMKGEISSLIHNNTIIKFIIQITC